MNATNTKGPAAPNAPKIVIRRSSKRMVVTATMKERLRANAKISTRTPFPELPEWQTCHAESRTAGKT